MAEGCGGLYGVGRGCDWYWCGRRFCGNNGEKVVGKEIVIRKSYFFFNNVYFMPNAYFKIVIYILLGIQNPPGAHLD